MGQSELMQHGKNKVENRVMHLDGQSLAKAGQGGMIRGVLGEIIAEKTSNRERIHAARSNGAFSRQFLEKPDQQHIEAYNGIDTGIAAVGIGVMRSAEDAAFPWEIQFLEQSIEGVPELRRLTTAQFAGRNPQLGLDG